MDIRQLEYFHAAAIFNSLTKAAQHLYVSQPTLSVAIQKLEHEIGIVLFDRSQKQFVLTTEGKIFFENIADILSRLQDTIGEMNEYKQLQKGHIKIGIPPMIGSFIFPKVLAEFKQKYPYLQLNIFEDASFGLRQSLEKGELDVGIVNLMTPSNLLATRPLARQNFLVCLPKNHRLAKKKKIELGQLKYEQFILFKEGAYNRTLIIQECHKHDFAPHVLLSTDQIETIKSLVTDGMGISFLIEAIALKSKEFVSLPLSEPLYIDFGIAWNEKKYLSNAARTFIDFVAKIQLDK